MHCKFNRITVNFDRIQNGIFQIHNFIISNIVSSCCASWIPLILLIIIKGYAISLTNIMNLINDTSLNMFAIQILPVIINPLKHWHIRDVTGRLFEISLMKRKWYLMIFTECILEEMPNRQLMECFNEHICLEIHDIFWWRETEASIKLSTFSSQNIIRHSTLKCVSQS